MAPLSAFVFTIGIERRPLLLVRSLVPICQPKATTVSTKYFKVKLDTDASGMSEARSTGHSEDATPQTITIIELVGPAGTGKSTTLGDLVKSGAIVPEELSRTALERLIARARSMKDIRLSKLSALHEVRRLLDALYHYNVWHDLEVSLPAGIYVVDEGPLRSLLDNRSGNAEPWLEATRSIASKEQQSVIRRIVLRIRVPEQERVARLAQRRDVSEHVIRTSQARIQAGARPCVRDLIESGQVNVRDTYLEWQEVTLPSGATPSETGCILLEKIEAICPPNQSANSVRHEF